MQTSPITIASATFEEGSVAARGPVFLYAHWLSVFAYYMAIALAVGTTNICFEPPRGAVLFSFKQKYKRIKINSSEFVICLQLCDFVG